MNEIVESRDLTLNLVECSTFESLTTITIEKEEFLNLICVRPIIENLQISLFSRPILVTEELEGRPDLISKIIFGSEKYFDVICEFNGISNPFSIAIGDVIIIPTLDSIKDYNNMVIVPFSNKSQIELNKKLPQKDKDRLNNKSFNETNSIKTTNMATELPYTIGEGVIILGTNVTTKKCKNELSQTQLLSEQVREAIRKKVSTQNQL